MAARSMALTRMVRHGQTFQGTFDLRQHCLCWQIQQVDVVQISAMAASSALPIRSILPLPLPAFRSPAPALRIILFYRYQEHTMNKLSTAVFASLCTLSTASFAQDASSGIRESTDPQKIAAIEQRAQQLAQAQTTTPSDTTGAPAHSTKKHAATKKKSSDKSKSSAARAAPRVVQAHRAAAAAARAAVRHRRQVAVPAAAAPPAQAVRHQAAAPAREPPVAAVHRPPAALAVVARRHSNQLAVLNPSSTAGPAPRVMPDRRVHGLPRTGRRPAASRPGWNAIALRPELCLLHGRRT